MRTESLGRAEHPFGKYAKATFANAGFRHWLNLNIKNNIVARKMGLILFCTENYYYYHEIMLWVIRTSKKVK